MSKPGPHRLSLALVLLLVLLSGFVPLVLVDTVRSFLARETAFRAYQEKGKFIVTGLMNEHNHLISDMQGDLALLAFVLTEGGKLRNQADAEAYLRVFKDGNDGCNNVDIAWPDGSVAASAAGFHDQRVGQAALPVLSAALSEGYLVSGPGGLSPVNQQPVIPCAYPLVDASGRAYAAILTELSLPWFHENMIRFENLRGAEVMIFDAADNLLASLPARHELLGRPFAIPPEVAGVRQGTLAVHEGRYIDGSERIFIIGRFEGGIRIVAGILKDVYLTDAADQFNFNHVLFLAIVAAALVLSRLIAGNLVVRPLKLVLDGAAELAAGSYAARIAAPKYASRELIELRDAFNEMAGHVQRHAAELDEARGRADAANRAKSDFLANMSHEIRTPIAGVAGLVDTLMADERDESRLERLRMIKSSSRHLLALVNDLLDLSSIEQGKFSLKNERFELGAFLHRELDCFILMAGDKGLNSEVRIDPRLSAWVSGDSNRLWQIITNLVGNAIKFTEKGWISIRAEALDISTDSLSFSITVADSGPGIPPGQLDRVFQPYYRVEHPYRKQNQGSGLGLWISKILLERMGGSISVESEIGRGSRFAFSLSLPRPVTGSGRDPAGNADSALRGLRALVAEDNRIGREVVRYMLEQAGCLFSLADDGVEAVRLAGRNGYDFAMLDVQMPGMSGLDALRTIREAESVSGRPRLPIFALTAYSLDCDHAEFIKAGFDACLVKPLRLEALVAALREKGVL